MRNAGAVDTEHIPLRISTIGSIISRGTPAQQMVQVSKEIVIDITRSAPKGFGLKPSTTRPVGWQRAWALAAARREQLGEGDAT
jgi:hypothetical protein